MSKPVLNYTLIDLGAGCYDLRPEPTQLRFKSPGEAQAFMKRLTENSTTSSCAPTTTRDDTRSRLYQDVTDVLIEGGCRINKLSVDAVISLFDSHLGAREAEIRDRELHTLWSNGMLNKMGDAHVEKILNIAGELSPTDTKEEK